MTHDDERARAGEPHIIQSGTVVASQGTIPMGLVMTKGASGFEEYQEVADEVLGTGDGATKAFTGTLAEAPAEPGSVVVADGTETFADDGMGRLVGDAGGTGTVNYATGAISVTFNANVTNEVDVTMDYVTRIDGVADEECDTSKNTSIVYVRWGYVRQDVLKVGISAEAEPDTTLLERMADNGLFAV